MANPSLKAKIEAAKSALEEDQNNTPLNQERESQIAPKTVPNPVTGFEPSGPVIAETATNFETDPVKLDARITRLEGKLAENQRDLYTLLGKIREVTRLQNEATKKNAPRNTRTRDTGSDHQNVTRHRGRRIAITFALLTGIILGTGFFLASDVIDQHLLHIHTWTMQFVDFISDIGR